MPLPALADYVVLDNAAYVVPAPGRTPDEARRAVAPVPAVAVRRIPRRADGSPDLDALRALPVLAEDPERIGYAPAAVALGRFAPLDLDAPVLPTSVHELKATEPAPPALRTGPALLRGDVGVATVTEAVLAAAERHAAHGVRVIAPGTDAYRSYPELLDEARRVLGGLHERGLRAGDSAVLLVPSLDDYVLAVWACLLGGIRLLTAGIPDGYTTRGPVLDRLVHAWQQLGHPLVITDDAAAEGLAGLHTLYGTAPLRTAAVSELRRGEPVSAVHPAAPDDTAVLVMSSGSTGAPKLVQVTHRAIVDNACAARDAGLIRPGEISFNWLPFDHAPPLVMYLLRDAVLGCTGIHSPTGWIAEQPLRWLDILQQYRVEHTWAANFGYRLVADALRTAPERSWDLSAVRTVLNAGEQCTAPVVDTFLERTAPFGLRRTAMIHAWGMAETATGICYKFYAERGSVLRVLKATLDGELRLAPEGTPEAEASEFLSMGPAAAGAQVRVVDDAGRVVPEGVIGAFQVQAARVTPGYLDNPEANAEAFPGDGWFDTGDQAFLWDGEVVITGRAKELINVNGNKYFCHEIEELCGRVEGVASGWAAACGVPDPVSGSEVLAVFFVPEGEDGATVIAERIREAVGGAVRLPVTHAVPLTAADFPRTTSGKVQRRRLVARFTAGDFEEALRSTGGGTGTEVPDCVYAQEWEPVEAPSLAAVLDGPVLVLADELGLAEQLPASEVILVRPGTGFAATGDGYRLDPASADDWAALARSLHESGTEPRTLLQLWSYLETPDASDAAAANERCGTYFAAACSRLALPAQVITVSRGLHRVTGDEPVCYPAALTAAIAGVLAQEHPDVRVRQVDLPGLSAAGDAEALRAALAVEAGTVAWRDGRPYVPVLTPVAEDPRPADALRRGGRYLVTGGTGGVGRALLGELAERYGLSLAVVGRRPAAGPDEQGPVFYRSADVTDAAALQTAVTEAEAHWGAPLDGVLHLADSYGFRLLAEETPDHWQQAVAAKTTGTLHLAELCRQRPGAHLIVFTSLVGQLGSAGCAAYSAGNAFADALGEHLRLSGVPVHTLAWGLWKETGLNRDNPYEAAVRRRGVLSLAPAEAAVLARVTLRLPPGAYCVGLDGTAEELRGRVRSLEGLALEEPYLLSGNTAAEVRDVFGRPVTVQPRTRPAAKDAQEAADIPADLLRTVREVFESIAGVPVPGDTPLFRVGLSSIQMLQAHARLEAALGLGFERSALFRNPSVPALARHLAGVR
ncbi:SDR family NAD(P)-dependent oxidoreductase [Streptomyces sp. ET3-23]|uniref:SDR family NAD(P)-dependent oxidoreductase n=1 Tax=Streptomyces sp. ET3-23 TaxID=2885643 RepID=UPI001D110369|nr:SDR family NAD(P)-dependent oxidoreductase [Streptomyces sp. ET3-23]MCC2274783.1 SDR family NAD(P)-dependent oxidoreductase [Streptomyces sp. ET3-23]